MASLGGQHENISNNPEVENTSKRSESREGSAERKASKDREEKLKYARDRQNEERHRKIEELRAQAEAAQRYREQKEEERRRRIEEIRVRDTEKRHQVEERKKAIFEAEKERREYILKKNQERESRIEVKRRDRNSIGFAFGSSTPRLLDVPADYGLVSPSAFWGQRRSTSISNVAGASLSRRSSERELADSGAKKRASSSTDRQDEDSVDTSPMVFRSVYRRKTDLMPTIPSPRDGHYGSRSSLSTTPARTPGSRSGNATPGGHFNSSRPGSAMSTSTNMSTSGLVPRRPATAPRKPRPASIAGTGMSLEEINKLKRDQKPPVKTTAASPSAQTTPKRTANLMSTSLIVTSSSSRLSSAEKKTPSKREPPVPKAASASKALPSRTASSERISRLSKEPKTKDNSAMTRSMIVTSSSSTTTTTKAAPAPAPAPAPVPVSAPAPEQNGMAKEVLLEKTAAEEPVPEAAPVPIEAPVAVPSVSKAEKEALNSEKTEEVVRQVEEEQTLLVEPVPEALIASINVEEKSDEGTEKETAKAQEQAAPKKPSRSKENSEVRELTPPEGADLMTASMMAKKITTEEEAKAALAERRRLAREEAERQAELERQRLEAERLAEIKAQEEEAERQRLFEEESTRLAEEQRRGEEERLRKAIEEAQQREEEEKRKREDEEKQRVEREEAEKKAKEEAEKQRVEVAERLKREEKEREERRKRVEAIMLRTRKGGAATTPSKDANDKAAPAASAPENNSSSNSSVSGSSNNSAEGSPSTADSTPAPTATETETVQEPPNSQAMYEQSVLDKENSLINSFSTMIIDENAKNLQQVSNGKLLVDFEGTNTVPAVANGNGHIENVNNKNDINLLQDAVGPVATQLIDLSIESQDLHLNNNNSLLTSTAATTTLVTADSHENKDISLL
ncbi:MAP7 domain-containing protein 1 isoform X13 [Drosophila gunungcola]|uniref:MAP7 domain-containing protein 1 isoform X13 n=1 Tax=Drosophila gunungcola TaxID=103775 RepID=UPI0022E93C96|nr:MAP7 domain-containing protein 1 isoform X13 [Drosophila gunungcola]